MNQTARTVLTINNQQFILGPNGQASATPLPRVEMEQKAQEHVAFLEDWIEASNLVSKLKHPRRLGETEEKFRRDMTKVAKDFWSLNIPAEEIRRLLLSLTAEYIRPDLTDAQVNESIQAILERLDSSRS